MTDFATPVASVSAFCRAVLSKLIPRELFGAGDDGTHNQQSVLRYVDVFIRLGRYESLSLHEVWQGLKLGCIEWLRPPAVNPEETGKETPKLSMSDTQKRKEILLEFVYYIFDSLLIPLIRSNFYVTESGVHKNRLFYFRLDVWRKLSAPSISQLKSTVFEEVKQEKAKWILSQRRSLGFSRLRLLPKAVGVRPIVNLRRRQVSKGVGLGKHPVLGPSINTMMAPMQSVLDHEKREQPELVGSAVATAQDIFSRLKPFKELLIERDTMGKKPLYFVKLDVQSCFDTIPQKKVIQLIEEVLCEDDYRISKHVEVTAGLGTRKNNNNGTLAREIKPRRRFVSRAAASSDFESLLERISRGGALSSKSRVFVDIGAQKRHNTNDLLDLLEQHIRYNLVRIGKKYFRQKNGIPQGSVVSALLCNFFYGEHEQSELAFLRACDEAVLFRLIDDYLFVTTDRGLAERFLQVMLDGSPDYGISVSVEKTLVNFSATYNGSAVPRLPPSQFEFPYCGTLIDTRTLAICKDRQREISGGVRVSDTITVDANKTPGRNFRGKILAVFRLQMHGMFLDTKHNSAAVALRSLYSAFLDSAMKMYTYQRRLLGRPNRKRHSQQQQRRQTEQELMLRIVSDVIRLAIYILRAWSASSSTKSTTTTPTLTGASLEQQQQLTISPAHVRWLAAMAFKAILGRKQTGFRDLLVWLDKLARASKPKTDREAAVLWRMVRAAGSSLQGVKF
jgi:telomerase reverse transcriptase